MMLVLFSGCVSEILFVQPLRDRVMFGMTFRFEINIKAVSKNDKFVTFSTQN